MEMEITFPGGVAVEAAFAGHRVRTDQPASSGGDDSGPSPFDLFLASLGTCTGFYALRFCQQRGLSTQGLAVNLRTERDPVARRLSRIEVTIKPPQGFPEKYLAALLRSADQCAVKKHLLEPPSIEVHLDGEG